MAAGLELPNLAGMREYRLARLRRQLDLMGYDGAILWDPMNILYATDTTNMQVWAGHFPCRCCWVGADGSLILWDFFECGFLSGHNPNVSEVRGAVAPTYFLAGPRYEEASSRWANEMLDVIRRHAGERPRIAMIALAVTFGALNLIATAISLANGHRGPLAEPVHLVELAAVILLWQLTPPGLLPRRRRLPPRSAADADQRSDGRLRALPDAPYLPSEAAQHD